MKRTPLCIPLFSSIGCIVAICVAFVPAVSAGQDDLDTSLVESDHSHDSLQRSSMGNRGLWQRSSHLGRHEKVDWCHVPPGNPANAHTISISTFAVPAHLGHGDYGGGCCTCSLSQGGLATPMVPLRGVEDPATFYAYGVSNPASAGTGLETSDTSLLFLYQVRTTGEMHLMVIHDSPVDVGGGRVSFTMTGVPSGAFASVKDDPTDPNDFFSVIPPNASFRWGWAPCCTDGVVLSGIGCDFEMTVTPAFSSLPLGGISSWVALSGDLSDPEAHLIPSLSDPVTLSCTTSE